MWLRDYFSSTKAREKLFINYQLLNWKCGPILTNVTILTLPTLQEEEKKKGEEEEALDETTLDWWSKYFASWESLNEVLIFFLIFYDTCLQKSCSFSQKITIMIIITIIVVIVTYLFTCHRSCLEE